MVAVMQQPGDLLIKRAGPHRKITLVGGVVFDVMIGQHQKAIRRPGFIGLQLGSLLRGEEGDLLSTHAEDKGTAMPRSIRPLRRVVFSMVILENRMFASTVMARLFHVYRRRGVCPSSASPRRRRGCSSADAGRSPASLSRRRRDFFASSCRRRRAAADSRRCHTAGKACDRRSALRWPRGRGPDCNTRCQCGYWRWSPDRAADPALTTASARGALYQRGCTPDDGCGR